QGTMPVQLHRDIAVREQTASIADVLFANQYVDTLAWEGANRMLKTLGAALAVAAGTAALLAQSTPAVVSGPVGPSPYNVIRYWHQPFSEPGFAFGGNSGVFAESPDRILIAQRGETRLPDPLPASYTGFAGSIGINVLSATDRRVMKKNFLYTLDANGK